LLRARFANYRIEEDIFSSFKRGVSIQKTSTCLTFKAPKKFTLNPNSRTSLAENEVAKILHLQTIANQTLDGFNNVPRITQTPLNEVQNVLVQISIPDTIATPTLQSLGK